MPTTVYATMEAVDQAYYDRKLLVRATPELVHAEFGQDRKLPTKSTKTIMFRRWEALAVATTALTEGVTPVGSSLSKTDITATVSQYGDYVTVSDILTWTSRDEVLNEAADVLGEQAGQSIDQIARDILVAGTSVFCLTDDVGASDTTRTNVDGLINAVAINKALRLLQNNNAKYFTKMIKPGQGVGTSAILPAFWGIISPWTFYTLRGISGFTSVKDYPSQQEVMKQEVGSYRELRLVMSTHAKFFPDAGANVASGHKTTTGTKEDVYATLIFAMNAYGKIPLTGHAMEMISKPLGSGGTEDPLNQRATSGWKAAQTFKILNNNFMTRLEHGVLA